MGIFHNRKREEQLENIILKLEKENNNLKNQVKKKEKAEWLDKELLSIAKRYNFEPLEIEHHRPLRYYGEHTELKKIKKTDENGFPYIEAKIVNVIDYDPEKEWKEIVRYECDLCGQENKEIDCFYLLKYKEWVKLIHPRPIWNKRNIFICWKCFEKIKDNLYKLSKRSDEK